MEQEKILKIIRGLNTFSPDDIAMMCDVDEDELEIVLQELTEAEIIQKVSDEKYVYLQKQKVKNEYLRLIEPKEEKINPTNSEMIFKDAAEYFLEHHAKKNCTPSTFKSYKSLIKSHLLQFFGKNNLTEISNDDIKAFIELKLQQKLKNKRLRNCVTLLGSMFEKFKEWNFVEKSPYHGIKNIRYSKNQKVFILNDIESKNLLKKSKTISKDLYLFILLALSTGLKKSEIMALKKEDIDLEKNTIKISKTLSEGYFVIPRGNAAIREIFAPKDVLLKLIKNKKSDDYIFYNTKYSTFTTNKIYRKNFISVLEKLDLPMMSLNDFRHTYAFNSLQSGMSIEYLHKQLGDYSIQATMDRYRDFIINEKLSHFRFCKT
jgi:integrase